MKPGAKTDAYESLWINVNKKSVVLNLKAEKGVEIARRLIAVSDVLLENYQKGVMERFGLDYESVKSLNPRLIYACSRGYGESGPYANYGNTAASNNSIAGWTHSAWNNNGAHGTKTLGIGDEAAGVSIALGVVAALYAREHTGEGQKIEVSMQEAVLGFMTSSLHEHFTGNSVGNRPMKVADGYFTLRVPEVSDSVWPKLANVIGRSDLISDERFATEAARGDTGPNSMISSEAGQAARPGAKSGTASVNWAISGRRFFLSEKSSRMSTSKRAVRSLNAFTLRRVR